LISSLLGAVAVTVLGASDPTLGSPSAQTEAFSILSESFVGPANVIATGAFTAGGTIADWSTSPRMTLRLTGGTLGLIPKGHEVSGLNQKTCLLTLREKGTYTLSRGTGDYKGIRGSGSFTVSLRGVDRRASKGSCNLSKRPVVTQAIMEAGGSVTLPSA
jgi:hypothetical protein